MYPTTAGGGGAVSAPIITGVLFYKLIDVSSL